jgi:Spy/CpxP family protein refolding chaperone
MKHGARGFCSSGMAAVVIGALLMVASAGGAETQKPAKKAPPPKAKSAEAKPAPAGPPPYAIQGGMIERHAKRLGLSDETVAAMRQIVETSRAENDRFRGEIDKAQTEMRTLLDQDVPDETAVMLQADKIGHLVVDQRKNQLRAMIKMRSMLTPEQRAELAKIRAEHPARREGQGAPGHGRPTPGAKAGAKAPAAKPPAPAN